MKLSKKVGMRIKQIRESQGIKQCVLAEKLNMEPSNLTRIESGYQLPKEENLQKIANVLGVEVKDLFDFSQDIKKDELIERLAAYENTGLTPEKITTMIQDRETAIGSLPNGTWWVKDNDGKSIPWREIPDSLYGALCKLRDYEKTGLTPSDVERLLWKE